MRLRPYQIDAAGAFASAVSKDPLAAGIISLPTGCGKTFTAQYVAREFGARTLWLAHRDELIDQPERLAARTWPEASVGVVKAERNEPRAADLVIASVQTVCKSKRLRQVLEAGDFGLVVVDEAHHAPATTYQKILSKIEAPVLGLTATAERTDRRGLGKTFPSGLLYRLGIREAVARGWLVPPVDGAGAPWKSERVVIPDFHPEKLRAGARDLTEAELEDALGEAAVSATIEGVKVALEHGRRPVVFTISVAVAQAVSDDLRAQGIAAGWVSGKTPRHERRAVLEAHRSGSLRVLVNCNVLTEGYDDPGIDAIVMARPTRSRPFYAQAIGRGLRPVCECERILNGEPCSCAKLDCLVVDLVGAHDAHGLVTADILESYDPVLEDPEEPKPKRIITAAPLVDNPRLARLVNYLRAVAGEDVEGDAPALTAARWLLVRPGAAFVLPAGDVGSIILERPAEDDPWSVYLEPRDRARPTELLYVERDIEIAQAVGEREVRNLGAFRLAQDDASWRLQPASAAQLEALRKWRHFKMPATAGEASDILSVLAAKSRINQRAKGRRRVISGWF